MSDDYRLLGIIRARLRAIASGMRFGRFVSVGVVGFVVDTIVITLLTVGFTVPTLGAKLASAETAIIVMFALNERWTFQRWGEAELVSLLRRFVTSNLVRTGGVAVATAVLLALNGWFGVWVPVANAIGIGVGFVVNFVFESLLTWRVHTSHSGDN
ncbi:GtrA family protein [Halorientalis brevis]|uniref:GtrA family protein n=1 Tax=Halorientalis brevis TaxID=1126241 RepID=A0ABD6CAD2_9EURY|nr:GtrA family protein [Halorientalis brevis]